jgi:predicted unusual protein kinase regulating ubiquinone biosynthesis (AarF/ABC1/UbiB family)
MTPPPDKPIKRIKTGFFERRMELAKAGFISGSKVLSHSAANFWASPEEKKRNNKELMAEQAQYMADELGKLKGSMVKIGQMMALYGEYFLPKEITDALHSLEDDTTDLEWPAIETQLREELGRDKLNQLEIEETPLASASLGQVHRARRIKDGKELCIKVQYPGVDKSIDSDFNAIIQLLTISQMITSKRAFEQWFREARTMLHQEVDYIQEAHHTQFAAQMLEGDERYIVPEVFAEYSTKKILTTSYEPGLVVSDPEIEALPLRRRNHLAKASLDLFLTELFKWGKMQTDPNFGNYRIRLGDAKQKDQLVLLDFGAMKKFPTNFLNPFRDMINSAYHEQRESFIEHAVTLEFMRADYPPEVLDNFADVAMEIIEPLAAHHNNAPDFVLNENGEYRWAESNLPRRIAKKASQASLSKYFALPPKEFMFMNRKLLGVYSFIKTLNAEFNGGELLRKFLE